MNSPGFSIHFGILRDIYGGESWFYTSLWDMSKMLLKLVLSFLKISE